MKKDYLDGANKKLSIYALSIVIGVGITILCMLIFAAIMLFAKFDREYAVPFATISLAVGTLFAARFASGKIGSKGYLVGLIIGVVVFLILLVISIVINRSSLGVNTLFHFIIIVLSSLIGGISGVNKRNKKLI